MVQTQITINHEPLDLMELSQMSIVKGLVSEHTVN